MSTYGVSASGGRGYSVAVNEQATNVSTPSKTGDKVHVQLGSGGETKILVPLDARLERIKHGKSEYMRLVVPGGSLTLFAEGSETGWPHIFINAGKHLEYYYADAEVAEVVHGRLGDLIPPTEAPE